MGVNGENREGHLQVKELINRLCNEEIQYYITSKGVQSKR